MVPARTEKGPGQAEEQGRVRRLQRSKAGTYTVVSFGEALKAAKAGRLIRRAGWSGKNLRVGAAPMTAPYLYIEYPVGSNADTFIRCPWSASQADVAAEDWLIAE